ncbi:MAG: hypothetical protein WCT42_00400 [Candidatus Paceibacterota bacterium]
MENQPRKSKAFIITIIAIVLLLVAGYFLYKSAKNSSSTNIISRIFSPLSSSNNSKGISAQAGEDIKQGDQVYTASTNTNGNPIVMKVVGSGALSSDKVLGIAIGNINNGEFGRVEFNTPGSNSFLDSFSNFINDLFTGNTGSGGTGTGGNGTGGNGTGGEYLQVCSDTLDNDSDGLIDTLDPQCHTDGDATNASSYAPTHYSELNSPGGGGTGEYTVQCNDKIDNDADGLIDALDPQCHVDGDLAKTYIPTHYLEASLPGGDYKMQCNDTLDNDSDGLIDTLDPQCHTDGDATNASSYAPTHYSELNSPTGICANGATNYPICTIDIPAGQPDLTAGRVTPISATIDTPTTLSSIITNEGDGATGYNFSGLFTIIKNSDTNSTTTNGAVSKSIIKNFIARILNKISWISKAIASNEIEYSVVVPALSPKTGNVATVSYTFNSTGTYNIRACADKRYSSDTGIIPESNEDNNCGPWVTLTVSGSLPPPGEECANGATNYPLCILGDDTLTQCSDTIDNDGDSKIDELDPNCHTDGDLTKAYLRDHDSEATSTITEIIEENKCLLIEQNPLIFTDTEKAKLAELLRKFYLISSTLRTEEDIVAVYSEIDQYKNFIAQTDDLIGRCYKEVAIVQNKGGGGGWVRNGNPWYRKEKGGTAPYGGNGIYTDFNILEGNEGRVYQDGKGPGCKAVSGYFYGGNLLKDAIIHYPPADGGDVVVGYAGASCDSVNTQPFDCYQVNSTLYGNNTNLLKKEALLGAGCKWKEGVYLDGVERILEIW